MQNHLPQEPTVPCNSIRDDIEIRPFVYGMCARCALPIGQDTDCIFCSITFNEEEPIAFGSRVKGQDQLWHFVYKTLWAR